MFQKQFLYKLIRRRIYADFAAEKINRIKQTNKPGPVNLKPTLPRLGVSIIASVTLVTMSNIQGVSKRKLSIGISY
jgi:hypothetical protein